MRCPSGTYRPLSLLWLGRRPARGSRAQLLHLALVLRPENLGHYVINQCVVLQALTGRSAYCGLEDDRREARGHDLRGTRAQGKPNILGAARDFGLRGALRQWQLWTALLTPAAIAARCPASAVRQSYSRIQPE